MNRTARLVQCGYCRHLLVICSKCDRGQSFCPKVCATIRRRLVWRRASERYQKTYKGRLRHAARQKAYRERQRAKQKIVTHTSSPEPTNNDVLSLESNQNQKSNYLEKCVLGVCSFCGNSCSVFVRQGFLNRRVTDKRSVSSVLGLGP